MWHAFCTVLFIIILDIFGNAFWLFSSSFFRRFSSGHLFTSFNFLLFVPDFCSGLVVTFTAVSWSMSCFYVLVFLVNVFVAWLWIFWHLLVCSYEICLCFHSKFTLYFIFYICATLFLVESSAKYFKEICQVYLLIHSKKLYHISRIWLASCQCQ